MIWRELLLIFRFVLVTFLEIYSKNVTSSKIKTIFFFFFLFLLCVCVCVCVGGAETSPAPNPILPAKTIFIFIAM